MLTPEEIRFFAGRPAELALYEQLSVRMKESLPPYDLRVQKTQITFINPKVFACVSPKRKGCIVVSLGLPDRIASERIHQAAEIRPGRWTLHIKVCSADELDNELLSWLMAAYLFAQK